MGVQRRKRLHISVIFHLIFTKREIAFEVATFGGSLLSECVNNRESLSLLSGERGSLLSGGRYFRNFTVCLVGNAT